MQAKEPCKSRQLTIASTFNHIKHLHSLVASQMALSVAYGRDLKTLDCRGPRGALSKEKALQFAEPVSTGQITDYERIILSTWAHSAESATVFADAIAKLPKLESAVVSDIIAGRPEAEGLAVYRALSSSLRNVQLKEIDLSDNAMGLKGIDACRGMLEKQEQLERMFFCNVGLSAEAARGLADIALYRGKNQATRFKLMHFDNNMSGGAGAAAVADIVAASPELLDFRFTSSRGARDGGIALARAFASTPLITKINLHDNLFADVSGIEMGRSVRQLHHLVHLDIGDTLLRDKGLQGLVSGLVRGPAPCLQHLDVSANELTHRSAPSLARIVRACPQLQTLRAEDNEWEDKGARIVASRGIACRAAVRRRVASAGADPLAEVVFSGCAIGNAGGITLALACAALPSLSMLDLGGNDMTASGLTKVRDALKGRLIVLGDVADQEGNEDDDEDEEEGSAEPLESCINEDGWAEDDSEAEESREGGEEQGTASAEAQLAAATEKLNI